MSLIRVAEHTFWSNGITARTRVLDLGANQGSFALEMRRRFGCQCVCVEPNVSLYNGLRKDEALHVMNVAIAKQSGRLPFHLSGNSEASSLLVADSGAEAVVVEAITLNECLGRTGWSGVDLVKMDIEGAEIDVLDSCSDEFLLSIPQLTIEFHDFRGVTPPSDVDRAIRRLCGLGFRMISTWRRFHGDVVFVQTQKAGVGLFEFLVGKYWVRNWWGLRRVLARMQRGAVDA
jgi:FkbM family methyltransferase